MNTSRLSHIALALSILLVGALQSAAAQNAATSSAPDNNSYKRGQSISLNFQGAEIDAVARTMAVITGRNVIVDPRVKGTINLQSEGTVSPAEAWRNFGAALRISGFAVVTSAGIDKVVPEADAKLQADVISTTNRVSSGQIATQIFKLNFENANNLVPVLRPLISPNNTINVNPSNNSLVITDYGDNLQRIARIIASMDVPNATNIEIIPLREAIASDLAPLLLKLLDDGGAGGANATPTAVGGTGSGYRSSIVPEANSNSLIVRAANPAKLNLIRTFIAKLDQAPQRSSNGDAGDGNGNLHVVYLKNADAAKLAVTLRAVLQSTAANYGATTPNTAASPTVGATGATSKSAPTATSALNESGMPSTGGQIQADPATNTLIITAPPPQYRQLRSIIDKLDGRRAQVYVESLIAEVSANKIAQFGIQWQTPAGSKGNSTVGILGTNYNNGTNIINLSANGASGTVLPSAGLNIGIGRLISGQYILSALANFLQTNGDANILSTPTLMTLDNEEARIVIGQNVPFITGQYTNNNSANGAVNPFQTIERKDVGLTLRVRPQISQDGTIKMQVFQEVSTISSNSTAGLITNKRSIETNVMVQDGAIVVLGGLLQDEYGATLEKIPFLGDLPIVGSLFKNESRTRKKTNLMVFLRPVVMRDEASTNRFSYDRYDELRSGMNDARPSPSFMLPVDSPTLQNGAPNLAPRRSFNAEEENADASANNLTSSENGVDNSK